MVLSSDIDGMDDNVDAEPSQVPPVMGCWTATSTYDVYMVDTPDKKNDEDKYTLEAIIKLLFISSYHDKC